MKIKPEEKSSLKLWELPLEEAIQRKFDEGRAAHGPQWSGKHPLIEAFDELIDALVYFRTLGVDTRGNTYFHDLCRVADDTARWLRRVPVELEDFDPATFDPEANWHLERSAE